MREAAAMDKTRALIFAGLLLGALVVIAYLVNMFWFASAEDRPTLMYFRADL